MVEGSAGGLGEKINEAIHTHHIFDINIFGVSIPVSDAVITMWIVMAFLILSSIIFAKNFQTVPKGMQNVIEIIVDAINNFVKGLTHHHWKIFSPYIGTVILFLVMSDMIAIFNVLPFFHIRPPTRNINVTACMALASIIVVIYAGIRVKGFSGWLKSFVEPMPIILPFKMLEYIIRPTSLALRLFGNILGAFIVMELLYLSFPYFAPAFASMYFDIFDGAIQAFVFVFTTLYT